jgi:hypothetical protein
MYMWMDGEMNDFILGLRGASKRKMWEIVLFFINVCVHMYSNTMFEVFVGMACLQISC